MARIEKPVDCPCGKKPIIDSDKMTGVWAVECSGLGGCGRLVAAKGRAECVRMWNVALCNMRDSPEKPV